MFIELSRQFAVRCTRVQGTVASPMKRAVEQAVVAWAKAALDRGDQATAELLSQDPTGPLLGRPAIIAERLLKLCDKLKLLERRAGRVIGLTEFGKRAIQDGGVFVPEYGEWSVLWSEDSTLRQPVLSIESHRPSSSTEEIALARQQRAQPSIATTPKGIKELEGRGLLLPSGPMKEARFDEVASKCEETQLQGKLKLVLRFRIDAAPECCLEGTLGDKPYMCPMELTLPSFEEIWTKLLASRGWTGSWQSEKPALLRLFSSVSVEGRVSFLEKLTFPALSLPSLGLFGEVMAMDVPVIPSADQDARDWFAWLLLREIQDYQWDGVFGNKAAELVKRFQGYAVDAPAQASFAESLRDRSRNSAPETSYWYLRAPIDLPSDFA